MNNLDKLFQQVEEAVEHQQQQDAWEVTAAEHFDGCVTEIFEQVKALLNPLQSKLSGYQPESVKRIWAIEELNGQLHVRFKERTLSFEPVGGDAKQESDKYTMQVLRNGNKMIRFELTTLPSTKPRFCVGHQGRVEEVSQGYLASLIARELVED